METPAEKSKRFVVELEKLYKQFGYGEIIFIVCDQGHVLPGMAHDPENPSKTDWLMTNVFVKVVDMLRRNGPFDGLELHAGNRKDDEWKNKKFDL